MEDEMDLPEEQASEEVETAESVEPKRKWKDSELIEMLRSDKSDEELAEEFGTTKSKIGMYRVHFINYYLVKIGMLDKTVNRRILSIINDGVKPSRYILAKVVEKGMNRTQAPDPEVTEDDEA